VPVTTGTATNLVSREPPKEHHPDAGVSQVGWNPCSKTEKTAGFGSCQREWKGDVLTATGDRAGC